MKIMRELTILYILVFFLGGCSKNETILFKDDFENHKVGQVPGAPWEKTGEGTVLIDDTKSFSGGQSVHLVSGEGYTNRAFIGIDHIFPILQNKYYGKLKMYVEEASPDGIHWTMIQSSGKVSDGSFSAEVRYGGQHHKRLMANYDTNGVKSDCWQHSEIEIPEQEWFSLQWYFDGSKNTMKLWLNEEEITSISVIDKGEGCVDKGTNGKWKFPVFENVLIGWVDYQTGGGKRSIWIDDVVISSDLIQE